MCVFLDILRCLFCCEEDDPRRYHRDVESSIGNRNQNPTDYYSELPNYNTYQRTVTPASSQSNAQTTSRIQSQSSSISSKLPQTSVTPSVQKPNILPPSPTPASVFQNKATIPQTSVTPSVQKPKILPPSPAPASVFQNKATNSDANRTIDQKLSHNLSPFSSQPNPPSSKPTPPLTKLPLSSSKPSPSLSLPPPPSSKLATNLDASKIIDQKLSHKLSPFSSQPNPPSSKPTQSLTKLPLSSSKPSPSLSLPPPPSSKLDSSPSSTSSGIPSFSTKPTLSHAPFNPTTPQEKTNYIWVEKGATPLYMIPEDIKDLIEKNIVPRVLKKPLSPSTYKDYFAALLYAEDDYLEKWDGFEMENVTLELHKASIYGWKSKNKNLNRSDGKDDKVFVSFEIDSIPEKRPFLLSRDFASVRPSGRKVEPFQGIIYRVVKSNRVLVEFGEDFLSQHYSACKYDVKFSFNRVCLKRAHQAIAAASRVLLKNFLFPDHVPKINPVPTLVYVNHKLEREQVSAVRQILNLQDPPPYLVEGPLSVLSVNKTKILSRTGVVVHEAVLQICRTSPSLRILICAPTNSTCDVLMRSLQKEIPESDMFRANAAFRELDGVPIDILPSCLYKGECFSCPSLQELRNFKVILSTFMSSFRLHGEGIRAGHFSHIFLVDASSATEPEAMVALVNLANESTAVVVTGASWNHSGWVRSNIARQNGLKISYFERLRETNLYDGLNPKYITQLKDEGRKLDDIYSSLSFF